VSTGPAELRGVGPARSRPFRGVAATTCAGFRGLSQPKHPVQLEVVGAWSMLELRVFPGERPGRKRKRVGLEEYVSNFRLLSAEKKYIEINDIAPRRGVQDRP